jgi:hypothetical protein
MLLIQIDKQEFEKNLIQAIDLLIQIDKQVGNKICVVLYDKALNKLFIYCASCVSLDAIFS